jgi:hypothetical protein
MITTRTSSAMARNIFRMFSACCSSIDLADPNLESFVTPSTSRATSRPKRFSRAGTVRSVSSGTSWRSAAAILSASIWSLANS